jgi:hypothetical protein
VDALSPVRNPLVGRDVGQVDAAVETGLRLRYDDRAPAQNWLVSSGYLTPPKDLARIALAGGNQWPAIE